MNKTFTNSFKVSFTENANTFIYFLKRIPFVGKKIPEGLYKQTNIKILIGIIREVLGIIGNLIGKAFYFLLMIILPSYLIMHKTFFLPQLLHIFFFLSFFIGAFFSSSIFDASNKKTYNMICLMKVDAKKYYLGQLIYEKLLDFIYFSISLIILAKVIGFPVSKALLLALLLTAFQFMGDAFHVFIYHKTNIIIKNKGIFIFSILFIGLFLGYALPLLGHTIDFINILFNNFSITIILAAGIISFMFLLRYDGYHLISRRVLSKENLFNSKELEASMNFGSVQLNEKKLDKESLTTKRFENKQGYDYLNGLFFYRHKSIIIFPIKVKTAIVAIIFLISLCLIFFIPDKSNNILKLLYNSTPFFVFVMYMMSSGETICKAMFHNCDVSLLRYGYYRQSKVILSNFTYRLKLTVMLNLIPALAICVAITGFIIAMGDYTNIYNMLPIFLCIICLSCFFSIHHLFMYYVVQPYTAELTIKSPLFTIVSSVMYFICYFCTKIKTSSYLFTIGVIIVTILYMISALIAIYKFAPKTFKLK